MTEQQETNAGTNTDALLADLDGGVFAEKIGRALSEVASGVCYTGKKGEVIVRFSLKRIGESSQVECAHSIKFVAPTERGRITEESNTSTPLHVGPRGALTLFPESQPSLFTNNNERAPA